MPSIYATLGPACRFLLPLAFGWLLIGAAVAAKEGTEASLATEIDYLVNAVADSGCTFIRNGREHDAAAASDHLRMKRERGRRYYDTAEEFIERIASRSSWSRKDYLIRCDSDEPVTAKEWFTARLAEYRKDGNDG